MTDCLSLAAFVNTHKDRKTKRSRINIIFNYWSGKEYCSTIIIGELSSYLDSAKIKNFSPDKKTGQKTIKWKTAIFYWIFLKKNLNVASIFGEKIPKFLRLAKKKNLNGILLLMSLLNFWFYWVLNPWTWLLTYFLEIILLNLYDLSNSSERLV